MNPLKKITATVIAIALITCLSGVAFAASGSDSDPSVKAKESSTKSAARDKANEKVKADMMKLVADAKAGKVAPAPQQFPPATRNNLSTAAKIGIIAAIGAGIFLIVMFHELSKD
ncbi:MAG TPA: hypothetical protein VNG71_05110 [Pyrinomonadaceae bacterium]|nr:hypothetical protein [Pyrinomonadaceae bacterium]